jgi:uncharacterized protein YbjT (DUF2867 family)
MTKPKILVTGANGRTGRPIVAALAKAGASVRAFIRDSNQAEALTRLGAADCAVGDMLDPDSIARARSPVATRSSISARRCTRRKSK